MSPGTTPSDTVDIMPLDKEKTVSANPMTSQVERVLDAMRPIIQQDGGDIELVAVTDAGEVQIRFLGACIGCPSRSMTLQSLVERNLKEYVPGFTSVTAVEA
ncbi:MAG: NifU family protein [Phycisphaerales bacterium]|nr:NifU family protein [Phycisphaerales bacterium]